MSTTIELRDAVPKYPVSYRRQSDLRQGGVLPTFKHTFVHCQQHCGVRIVPARIEQDDADVECYPGASEELLEDVLRKISCDQGMSFIDDNRSGVTFTIHRLKKELAARVYTRSYLFTPHG